MPGLTQRNDQFSNATSPGGSYSISANSFWSKHRDDVSFNQLQKVLGCFISPLNFDWWISVSVFVSGIELDHCFT